TEKDPAIRKALGVLARHLDTHGAPGQRPIGNIGLYFLWSVERVGVLYNLRTIGGKDWYRWGADLLVKHQGADGSWACGGYWGSSHHVDTSFALLFLKRANRTRDLTRKLDFLSGTRK